MIVRKSVFSRFLGRIRSGVQENRSAGKEADERQDGDSASRQAEHPERDARLGSLEPQSDEKA